LNNIFRGTILEINDSRIHPDLIEIALDKVEGFVFERFVCDMLSSVEGRNRYES